MSIYLSSRVWREVALPTNKKLVLARLADYADDDDNDVRPSIGRLAHETGLGESIVSRFISEFCAEGILEPTCAGGELKATRFRLHLEVAARLHPLAPFERTRAGGARSRRGRK